MKNSLFKDTEQLTFMGLMFALSVLFVYTLGMLPASIASLAVLTFIPCMLTGIVYGPAAGAFMGGLTGLITLTRAIVAPTSILDPLFINPLISVLPRIFVGVVPYYAYNAARTLFKGKDKLEFLCGGVAGFFGAITNTALVMLMLYLICEETIVSMMGASFKVFLVSIISTNALIEAIVTFALLGLVCAVYFKVRKRA